MELMADEDTILEARKFVPHYARQITWSAHDKIWQVSVPELPGCMASGDSADSANRNADEQILLHLLNLRSQDWPRPKKLKP